MKYYVSNAGDDAAHGTKPGAAWRTLSKVNEITFQPGDQVLFRRGDTFFGAISPRGFRTETQLPVTFGAYGIGEMPIISRYKILTQSSWVLHAPDIYKIDLTDTSKWVGDQEIGQQGVNVGFLKFGQTIYGAKKFAVEELVSDWQFYSDKTQWLYVRLAGGVPEGVRAAIGTRIFDCATNGSTGLRFTGLAAVGCAGHGISGAVRDTVVTGCRLGELGGGELIGFPTPNTRYGNGAEMFTGSYRSSVRHNVIHDVYDVATTLQGNLATPVAGWLDCWFEENFIYRCTQSFEVWGTGVDNVTPPAAGSGFIRSGFRNNICMDAGLGWAGAVNPAPKTHLLIYTVTVPETDILVKGNKFYRTAGTLFSRGQGGLITVPPNYRLEDNQVFLTATDLLMQGRTNTISTWAAFATAIGTGSDTVTTTVTREGTDLNMVEAISKLFEGLAATASNANIFESAISAVSAKAEAAMSEVNDLVAASQFSGFETLNGPSSPGDAWAQLAVIECYATGSRVDGTMHYQLGADSTINRQGVGILSFQIVPDGGPYIDLRVIELMNFRTGPAPTDFAAVIVEDTLGSGGKLRVALYFNIGKDSFAKMKYMPISTVLGGPQTATVSYRNNVALLPSLPAGTVSVAAKYRDTSRDSINSSTDPSVPPTFFGQEWQNTTTRKCFKAFGISTLGDWEALN